MNATIKSSFWTDDRLEETSPEIKLAVLWLITNPARDLCGFVRVSNKRFTFETGLPASSLDGASKAMPSSIRKLSGGVWFVANFLRHQFGKGGLLNGKNKVLIAARRHAESLPSAMLEVFQESYPELFSEDTEMIPHASPIHGGCHGVRVRVRERVGDIKEGVPGEDIPGVVAIYPKRHRQTEAIEALAAHVRKGTDLDAVAAGTRAIAAIIQRMPGGCENIYVPSAATFFRNRRWEDDPKTWLRNAKSNGAPVDELYQGGGRKGTTIELKCP